MRTAEEHDHLSYSQVNCYLSLLPPIQVQIRGENRACFHIPPLWLSAQQSMRPWRPFIKEVGRRPTQSGPNAGCLPG